MPALAESESVIAPARPVHTLDVLASMVMYPGHEGLTPFTAIDQELQAQTQDLCEVIGHPDNHFELSGWLVKDGETYHDWQNRFTYSEVARALGTLTIISGFVAEVGSKVTEEVAVAAEQEAQQIQIGEGPLPPLSAEERAGVRVLRQYFAQHTAIVTARRVFESFDGGPLLMYQEALAASAQAIVEDDEGTALHAAVEHVKAYIASQGSPANTTEVTEN